MDFGQQKYAIPAEHYTTNKMGGHIDVDMSKS